VVLTSSEYFSASGMFCIADEDGKAWNVTRAADVWQGTTTAASTWTTSAYGSVWDGWAYDVDSSGSGTYLKAQDVDTLLIVGSRQGSGILSRFTVATSAWTVEASGSFTTTTANITTVTARTANNSSVLHILPPKAGMAQFKGTTATNNQLLYLNVICVGVAPVYTTWAVPTTSTLSFLLNCYTGIPQCGVKLTDGFTSLDASHSDFTQHNLCLEDPRYLTWRSFLI